MISPRRKSLIFFSYECQHQTPLAYFPAAPLPSLPLFPSLRSKESLIFSACQHRTGPPSPPCFDPLAGFRPLLFSLFLVSLSLFRSKEKSLETRRTRETEAAVSCRRIRIL